MKLRLRTYAIAVLAIFAGSAFAEGRSQVRTWQISFELAFGEGSPYGQRIKPSLYEVPYATNHRVTSTVLPEIAKKAKIMTGVELVSLYFGPGGYEEYVNPSAQMIVRGTPGQARLACSIIGYLVQQTEVIASSNDPAGNVQTYDIQGFKSTGLEPVKHVQSGWTKLNSLSEKLVGFLPLPGPKGGIRILNMGDKWSQIDLVGFRSSVQSVFGFGVTPVTRSARLLSSKNDWRTKPAGEAYLVEMQGLGRSDVARRVKGLRSFVEGLVKQAYRRYIPAQRTAN